MSGLDKPTPTGSCADCLKETDYYLNVGGFFICHTCLNNRMKRAAGSDEDEQESLF